MTEPRRLILLVTLVVVLFASGAFATVAAQNAPECSAVTYDGSGTDADPYEVGDVDQLQCIEDQGLSSNYVQVSDIDATETASWNGGDGFEPIGGYNFTRDTEFNGTFDGVDHTVSGLTTDRSSTLDVGLFGGVGSGGRLENVSLENVNITGDIHVGGLVGSNNDGTVENSHTTGDISGDNIVGGLVGLNGGAVTDSYATGDVSGDDEVGGLVGRNVAAGTVKNSYATGGVSGSSKVGGLVGRSVAGGTVENSYATGSVSGDDEVGGLVGINIVNIAAGTVENSYATGSVSGNKNVGGLVGSNNDGTVERSYATGDVTGNKNVGGLIGNNDGGNITESYWDTESTGQPNSEGGTGLTTSEMTGTAATSNMGGFDFTYTWRTVTNPDEYPVPAWQTGNRGANTGNEGEGMPGFTAVTAMFALLTVVAAWVRRREE